MFKYSNNKKPSFTLEEVVSFLQKKKKNNVIEFQNTCEDTGKENENKEKNINNNLNIPTNNNKPRSKLI